MAAGVALVHALLLLGGIITAAVFFAFVRDF